MTPVDQTALPGTAGLLALFDVVFTDQGRERYCIPVAPPETGQEPFVDAMTDPPFCLALLEAMRGEATLAGARGVFRFTATAALAELLPTAPRECRPIGRRAEQHVGRLRPPGDPEAAPAARVRPELRAGTHGFPHAPGRLS